MTEEREQYQQRVEKEFSRLADQLGRFMARVETRARREYQTVTQDLSEKSQTAQQRLQELKSSSSEAWKDLKPGFESAWEDLREAFSKARRHFGQDKPDAP